jgi:hypothetical protein
VWARLRDGGVYVGVLPGVAPASVRGIRTDAVKCRPHEARLAKLVQAHARLAQGGVASRSPYQAAWVGKYRW